MLDKPKCIVFDLDWTLCELWDSANTYNHDGEEYVISEIKWILDAFWYNYEFPQHQAEIIIMTGRKRKEYGEITKKYLRDNDVVYEELIMQEWSQAEKNHIYKEKELIKLQERYDIIAMFDDNEDLIPVCKKLWILLLTVHI